MLYIRNILMVLAMAAVSFTAGAQEVYKSVGENGVIEFSDTPTPEAQVIEVDPNVVDVTPVKSVDRSREASATAPEVAAEPGPQPEVVYQDDNRIREDRMKVRKAHDEASEHPVHAAPVNRGGRVHAR
jgi:hypothetical protein